MSTPKKRKKRESGVNDNKRSRSSRGEGGDTRYRTQAFDRVMACVFGRAGAPVTADEALTLIREKKDFGRTTLAAVQNSLLRMLESGVIVTEGGRYRLSPDARLMSGRVSGTRSGRLFFDPDEESENTYVFPREYENYLFHGDRVMVSVMGFSGARDWLEVSVEEVLERRTHTVVGTVKTVGSAAWLTPSDPRVRVKIRLTGAAIAGQGVVADIVAQPTLTDPARAQVREILGSAAEPQVEIEMAARRFGLPSVFADDVTEEANALPDHVLKRDSARRVDLRDIPFVTIDGEDARDFDDAVWCAPVKGGKGWRLLVAIADVSWYVKPGTALDRSAQERLTSVYFPRRVIPMLPEALSNGLCSLNPDVDRCTMVCDAVIGEKGTVTAYQFYPAVIHSHGRLTYTQVWNAIQGDLKTIDALGDRFSDVMNLYTLYTALAEARKKRGAINFESRETYIESDEEGHIVAILPREHNDAHRLIEEAMLVANTCAADFITRRKAESLFRIHEGPGADRLQTLRATLSGFGLSLGGGDNPRPSDYEEVMKKIRGTPDEETVQTMLLRSMQRAVYSPDLKEHFGLAYRAYTHFTSPIRRYPDLLVHRTIRGILSRRRYKPEIAVDPEAVLQSEAPARGRRRAQEETPAGKTSPQHPVWTMLGRMCSAAERRADEASLDVTAWLKCMYMKDYVGGKTLAGHVTSVTPAGVYVTLDEMFVEGFVHISNLGWDYYDFDPQKNTLTGSASGEVVRAGFEMKIRVTGIDIETRRIEFVRAGIKKRTPRFDTW